MSLITITCPACGHSKRLDRAAVPANVARVRCPACAGSFAFADAVREAGETPPDPAPAAGTPVSHGDGPSAVPPASPPVYAPKTIPFVFTGNAREYFGIWIVNTLLKIVTLGIYSPWAKVRKRQYFYGNTLLDDANFDYLANPLALLKGWLLGAALFVLYSVGSQYSPIAGMVFGLLVYVLVPWIIVRSRLFNNRNSAYRNIRFNFEPAYGEAYKVFILLPFLSVFTLGFLMPYVYYRQKRFLMENNRYGESAFAFDARISEFYIIALKTAGIGILVFGLFFAGAGVVSLIAPDFDPKSPAMATIIMPAAILAYLGGYLLIFVYSYVRTVNLTLNCTRIGRNRLSSNLRVRDMSWIMFSNVIASVLSVGLLIPWATVRLTRYRLERLSLLALDDLGAVRGGALEATSAAGEEIGDIFGIELGFG